MSRFPTWLNGSKRKTPHVGARPLALLLRFAERPEEVQEWCRNAELTDAIGETWRRIPPDIIHWNIHAPSGQPKLLSSGKET
jgi:hypothetical protein